LGSISDLHFMGVDPQAKFVPIDEQTDDNVMHLDRLGKADRLARLALDTGVQRQVLALDLLRVPLARLVLFTSKMTRVGTRRCFTAVDFMLDGPVLRKNIVQ
jgi:hypothetical protein